MRNLTATICLTIAVLLGSSGVSWGRCVGSIAPGGPCSIGPGGGLSIGPGGGRSIGPGGGLSIGPGGGRSIGPGGGRSIGPGGGRSIGPGGGRSIGPGGGRSIGPGGGRSIGPNNRWRPVPGGGQYIPGNITFNGVRKSNFDSVFQKGRAHCSRHGLNAKMIHGGQGDGIVIFACTQ